MSTPDSAPDNPGQTAADSRANETILPGSDESVAESFNSGPQPGKAFGRYQLLECLGQGAMGAVYKAHDSQLDRTVAIKIPKFDATDAGLLERFYLEARSAATLSHVGICPVHDVGEIDGTHYISMGYIEGKELSAYINPAKPISAKKTAAIVRRMAVALNEAHDRGIVHRDLKPDNVMIDAKSNPVIMDFGLARRGAGGEVLGETSQASVEGDSRMTQAGQMIGTPAYMSPEQVDGDVEKMGPKSDIYSLGVILYEMLTCRVPYEGSIARVLAQVIQGDATKPSEIRPDVNPELEAICLKMMAPNPDERYESMGDVGKDLAAFLKGQPTSAKESLLGEPAPSRLAGAASDGLVSAPAPSAVAEPTESSPAKEFPSWAIPAGGGALGLVLVIAFVLMFGGGDDSVLPDNDESVATVPGDADPPEDQTTGNSTDADPDQATVTTNPPDDPGPTAFNPLTSSFLVVHPQFTKQEGRLVSVRQHEDGTFQPPYESTPLPDYEKKNFVGVWGHPGSPFVYVTDGRGPVHGYRVENNGGIVELPGSPFEFQHKMQQMMVGPNGRFAYTFDKTFGVNEPGVWTSSGYRIEDDGRLTLLKDVLPELAVDRQIRRMVFHPSGRFLYMSTSPTSDEDWGESLYGFRIETTGQLSLLPGYPINPAPSGKEFRYLKLEVDPLGEFLVAATTGNQKSWRLRAHRIDPATGLLVEKATASVQLNGDQFLHFITHPDGFVYVHLGSKQPLIGYTLNRESGELQRIANLSVPTAKYNRNYGISPDRRFLYWGHRDEQRLTAYRVESDGQLTKSTDFNIPIGNGVLVHPASSASPTQPRKAVQGKHTDYLVVVPGKKSARKGQLLSIRLRDDGKIQPPYKSIPFPEFKPDDDHYYKLIDHPEKPIVYLAGKRGELRGFSVSNDGDLAELAGSPFETPGVSPGWKPVGVNPTLTPDGRFIFAGWRAGAPGEQSHSNLPAYRVEDDGQLTLLPDSVSGAIPLPVYDVVVHPSSQFLYAKTDRGDDNLPDREPSVYGFRIESSGALTPLPGFPICPLPDGVARHHSCRIWMDPLGDFLVVGGLTEAGGRPWLLAHSIDSATGTIQLRPESRHAPAAGKFFSMWTHPKGYYYMCRGGGEGLIGFTIDRSSGKFYRIPDLKTSGMSWISPFGATPDGRFIYVGELDSQQIQVRRVANKAGTLDYVKKYKAPIGSGAFVRAGPASPGAVNPATTQTSSGTGPSSPASTATVVATLPELVKLRDAAKTSEQHASLAQKCLAVAKEAASKGQGDIAHDAMAMAVHAGRTSQKWDLVSEVARRVAFWRKGDFARIATPLPQSPPSTSRRLLMPDETARTAARQKIDEVFQSDVQKAKSAAAMSELAQRLVKLAGGTEDAIEKFTLLDKAADLATEAGDVGTALKIVDAISTEIAVKGDTRPSEILIAVAKKVRTPALYEELAGRLITSCKARKVNQGDLALELAEEAVDCAVKSRNIELRKLAVAAQSHVRKDVQAYEDLSEVRAALEEDILDPEANLQAGRYYCYIHGNWGWGTDLFLMASDGPERELALLEADPKPDVKRLADGWRKLSETADADAANAIRRRAGFWYVQAAKQLTGVGKNEAQARVREMRGFNVYPKVNLGANAPPAELISVTDGFSFLSYIAGAWEGGGQRGDLIVNDDVWHLKITGKVGIGATSVRVSESKRFKPVVRHHTWKKGTGPLKLIARSEGFCVLSSISGRFEGGGEQIRLYIGRDGYWYLDGNAAQGVTAAAVSFQFPGRDDFPAEYQQYNWGNGDRGKKRMIHSSEGFCILSTVGGALEGGGEHGGVSIDESGYWTLGGGTGQASFHLRAISVKLKDGWP